MSHTFPYSMADYFAFVAGVALLLTATHAFALWYSYRRGRRWAWLLAFLLACSFASVMESLAVDAPFLGAAPPLVTTGFALATAMGIGYLAEATRYSRRLLQRVTPLRAASLGAVPLIAAVALAWLGRQPAHLAIALLFLGVVFSVTIDLLRLDVDAPGRGGLVAAGLGIGVWGVSQPLIAFAIGAGDSPALAGWAFLAAAAAALTGAVGMEPYLTRVAGGWGADSRVRVRRGLRAALIALVLIGLFGGVGLTDFLGRMGAESQLDALTNRVRSMAAALSATEVQTLQGTPGDAQSGAYEELLDALDRAIEQDPDAVYLYVMRGEAGRALILAEAVGDGGERSAPGTVFGEASPELLAALDRGEPLVEGPVADSFGTWYSALAPVVNHDTGAVVAHLGIDVPASAIDMGRQRYRLGGIALALSISVLIVGLYTVLQLTRAAAAITAESEERYRGLFEHAPDGIIVAWADSGEIVAANPRVEQWLGVAKGGLVGEPIDRFVTCAREHSAMHRSDCAERSIEDRDILKGVDGREINAEFSVLGSESRERSTVIVFVRDASDRIAAAEAASSRATFNSLVVDISRRFIESTPDTVDTEIEAALARIGNYANVDRAYVFEMEDGATMSNTHEWAAAGVAPSLERLQRVPLSRYEWTVSRVLARREVYIPDVEAAVELAEEEREALLASGVRSMLIVPIMVFGRVAGLLGFDSVAEQKDWSPDSIALLRMVAGIIGATLHRTQAESELLRVSQAVSQSPVGVMITDADAHIVYVNPKFTEVTGYTLDEVRDERPKMLASGLTSRETYGEMWAKILSGHVWSGELVDKRKDGTPYWARNTISAVYNSTGEIVAYVAVQEDVTDAKEAQEALHSAKIQAESANRAKSEFLATMSHEIRTPMNAIIGMSELLQESGLSRQQGRYVDVLQRAGESLLGLINSILDLSKIEADRLELEYIPFDLVDVAETAVSVVGMQAAEKGIELLYRIKPDTQTALVGDPERLRQVFINLLGNAVKFTDVGQVYLSIEPEPGLNAGHLLIRVADTGVGIAADKLDTVFESFAQADTSVTRRYGGTGLGLTISKRLIELMGGELTVESEPGQGTTFTMRIPFLPAREPIAPHEQHTAEQTIAGKRVLIVDDNETNRFILREVLASWGMRTSEASDASSAIESARFALQVGEPYDVLILDHQMPGVDGCELLERLRSQGEFSALPAIMLSSDAHGRGQELVGRLGLADYLLKPVRRHELEDAIRSALRGEWLRPREMDATDAAGDGAHPAEAVLPHDEAPLSILLAEDSEDNRFLIRSYFAKTPHVLTEVEDGRQAIEAVTSADTSFDLVLMDMQMPVLDGASATREIRAWERENDVRPHTILALSAFALSEERESSIEAGCDAHLTKPIKKKELLKAVSDYARER